MNWHDGPVEADLGGVAKIDLPDGYASLNRKDTRRFVELIGNISNESQVGLIVPRDSTSSWFLVFSFDLCGYVKDDEKQELDPGKMLGSIRSDEETSNKRRVEKGLKPIHAVGWQTVPRYNAATNNLEWCLILESDEGQSLNHHIRILGRTGVMKAIVVAGEEELDAALAATSMLLTRFQYREGNRYAEWTAGDKVAKYGLTALVTGGAVAVAAKSGLLGKLIKPLLLVLIALGGFFARFFRRLFGRKENPYSP